MRVGCFLPHMGAVSTNGQLGFQLGLVLYSSIISPVPSQDRNPFSRHSRNTTKQTPRKNSSLMDFHETEHGSCSNGRGSVFGHCICMFM